MMEVYRDSAYGVLTPFLPRPRVICSRLLPSPPLDYFLAPFRLNWVMY